MIRTAGLKAFRSEHTAAIGMVLEKVLLKSLSFSAGGSTYGMTRSTLLMSFLDAISVTDVYTFRSVWIDGVARSNSSSKGLANECQVSMLLD